MPVIQSVFNDDFATGYPGMVANGETSNRISRTAENAAGIPFGRACFRGSADHFCDLTIGADFLGISIADHGIPQMTPGQAVDSYPQYHNVGIMERGVIWVLAGGAFPAPGTQVAVLNADGTFVAGGTAASTNLPGWRNDTSAVAGQLMLISNNRAG